jgi:hypothetical protein
MKTLHLITGAAAGVTIALALIGYVENIVTGHETLTLIIAVIAALIFVDYQERGEK